jgi:hypothetical protein
MRYTKSGLLVFGLGLLLGLVVLAAEIKPLERVASGAMALGIAAIPVGMIADWRRATRLAAGTPRRGKRIAARRAPPAARRPRKPASAKR